MKLTRERKIFGAVLVVALGVFGYDQLFGSSPSTADASASANTLLLASISPSNKPARISASAAEEISLASRLTTLALKTGTTAPNAIRDVFQPAEIWLPKTVVARVSTVSSADKFVRDHKLSTVSINATGGGVAVVDGKLLHIGGRIDGYQLVAINQQNAIFQSSDGARAKLKLPSEPLSGR
jgi:hypothetical protein